MAIEDVTKAKADLLAAGENLDGKCGAHKIAAQTAWAMRGNGQGWGLVHSTGSGCEINNDIYRGDSVMLKSGVTKDILLYAESKEGAVFPEVGQDEYNIPAWNDTGDQDPANWREPYDPGLVPDSGGGETPVAPADTQTILDAITASQAALEAHVTAEADRTIDAVLDDIKRIEEEVEHFAEIVGKGLLLVFVRRHRDEPPAPPAPPV